MHIYYIVLGIAFFIGAFISFYQYAVFRKVTATYIAPKSKGEYGVYVYEYNGEYYRSNERDFFAAKYLKDEERYNIYINPKHPSRYKTEFQKKYNYFLIFIGLIMLFMSTLSFF